MTKKAKSPYAIGKPFPDEVCDAIRHHIGCRKALESQRKNAFEDRDAAIAEMQATKDKEEILKIKARHSDAVIKIDDLSTRVKWHSNQVDELVEKADEPELEFMYHFEEAAAAEEQPKKKKGDASSKAATADDRPVGRIRPETVEGVDEHLQASVNELDIRENIKGKLIAADLPTISCVVAVLDSPHGDIRDAAGLSENMAAELKKAVKSYRTKHRRAALKLEGGEG